MITDIEFQNRRDVMRVAPWLDMPLLRAQLRVILQEQLDDEYNGFMRGYVKTYREDMQSFCNGTRERIPRCSTAVQFVRRQIPQIFPTAAIDAAVGEATQIICTHIMQVGTWRSHDRGNESQETAGEGPHRVAPAADYEPEYDEYNDEEY